jgi:hypothetical protein
MNYYGLLREAFQTQDAVDMFDLRSEDPVSAAEFLRLVKESDAAQLALIEFIKSNPNIVEDIFLGKIL